jgi:hypothetical protein
MEMPCDRDWSVHGLNRSYLTNVQRPRSRGLCIYGMYALPGVGYGQI